MSEQTLEQLRMRYALAVVKHSFEHLPPANQSEYVARTRQLPAQILQNGLNQALTFCLSKRTEPAYASIFAQVDGWLTGRGPHYAALHLSSPVAVFAAYDSASGSASGSASDSASDSASGTTSDKVPDVVQIMLEHSMDHYMEATQEALAVLHHIKRFAAAFKPAPGAEPDHV